MTRSSHYQHQFCEVQVESVYLESFDANPEDNQEIIELNEEAAKIISKIVMESKNKVFSDKQKQMLNGIINGLTQTEMANEIGVNQSTICKSLEPLATQGKRFLPEILQSERLRQIVIRLMEID